MQQYSTPEVGFGEHASPPRERRVWLWVLLGAGGCLVLVCGGGLALVMYLGLNSPDTAVYTGNQVPQDFVETMKSVSALDDDESILFFYSDGITDITDGFYFVSDKKVAVYFGDSAGPPLTAIPFDNIKALDLYRDESFFVDSQITLTLTDDEFISFPVSSEFDKDQMFFDAIKQRCTVD